MTEHIHKFGAWIEKLERITEDSEGEMVIEATIRFRAISEKDLKMTKQLGINQPIMLVITD